MLLNIHHETHYRYQSPASYSLQSMRLWPRTDGGQRVHHWRVDAPGRRWIQKDAHGNTVHLSSLVDKHDHISVTASGLVETLDARGHLIANESEVPVLAFSQATALTMADASIRAVAISILDSSTGQANERQEALLRLCQWVHQTIEYTQGVTDVSATAAEVVAHRQGVCQDMTHVFLALCRSQGVSARYVSGYLLTDATHAASHAWAEVWMPLDSHEQGGWLGFDVTHNRLAGPELCRLAVGRDYADTSPIRGIHMGGVGESMAVRVAVRNDLSTSIDQ
jgi:transglutaminase-like putative cysteine protease